MKKANKHVQVGLGAASILMIFVILCMMVLSVLSYTQAAQEDKTAKREERYQRAYHDADMKADILYELLEKNASTYVTWEDLLQIPQIKTLCEDKDIVCTPADNLLHVRVSVNNSQRLIITLEKTTDHIVKKSWKLSSTGGE